MNGFMPLVMIAKNEDDTILNNSMINNIKYLIKFNKKLLQF